MKTPRYTTGHESLVCFRSSFWTSGLFFLFRSGSEVSSVLNFRSSSCWTNEQKVDLTRLLKLPTVRVGLFSATAPT